MSSCCVRHAPGQTPRSLPGPGPTRSQNQETNKDGPRLIKLTVEGLRARLDRLYLESLDSSTRSGATRRLAADEVSALQEELESLYAEILPVAQMSVEQQFLEPALQDLAAKHGQGLSKSEAAIRYVGRGPCDIMLRF